MIYRLTIENFGSIKDRQILDFTVSGKVSDDSNRLLAGCDGIRVPKVVAVLGANASGKTTVLRALGFLTNFAAESAYSNPDTPLLFHPFSDADGQGRPTILSVEFTADWVSPGISHPFRYTLKAIPGNQGFERWVGSEVLEYKPLKQWTVLASREGNKVSFKREMGRLGGSLPPTAVARKNSSIFSLLRQFVVGSDIVDRMFSGITSVISNFYFWHKSALNVERVAQMYASNPNALAALNKMIRRADLGINGVSVREILIDAEGNKRWMLMFDHSGLTSPLASAFESQGTMNFVTTFPIIYSTLISGGVALMDEMDSDLHPELLREIVGWFFDPDINQKGAQLFTSCNNPAVLDELYKEEIFFSKKDDLGRTSIFALKEIPGVRRRANFQRDYLAGRYGAVPYIG